MYTKEFLDKLRCIVVDYDKTYGNWPESKFEGLAFYQYALYHCDIEDDSEILENTNIQRFIKIQTMDIDNKCCDPDAPTETCMVCGRYIYTCERKESVNDSYLCPVIEHNNGWELHNGFWVCSVECEHQYFADLAKPQWFDNLEIKWFHPFNFLFIKRPKMDTDWHPSDDIYQYGFSLDLTTEMYYYTYDWGKGFNLRVLGFGFEIVKVGR